MATEEPDKNDLPFENELKKLKLRAEYGAVDFDSDKEKLSPETESQFLDHVMAFEKAAETKETQKVFELLDKPEVPKPDSIPDDKLEECLDYVIKIMASKLIYLEVIYEVSSKELYRFIVEELFEHEMDLIEVPGLESHFTYEEFHPNLGEDAKTQSADFLRSVFDKKFEYMHLELWSEISSGEQHRSAEEFAKHLQAIIAPLDIRLLTVDTALASLDTESAEVHCQLHYELTVKDQVLKHTAPARIGFHHAYGYTYINRVELAGFVG